MAKVSTYLLGTRYQGLLGLKYYHNPQTKFEANQLIMLSAALNSIIRSYIFMFHQKLIWIS